MKETQFGKLALLTTTLKENGGLVKSFNKAIVSDAEAFVAGKYSLPKNVKVVQAKAKGPGGKQYFALEEA